MNTENVELFDIDCDNIKYWKENGIDFTGKDCCPFMVNVIGMWDYGRKPDRLVCFEPKTEEFVPCSSYLQEIVDDYRLANELNGGRVDNVAVLRSQLFVSERMETIPRYVVFQYTKNHD